MAGLDEHLHAPNLNQTALENPQEFFDCVVDRCKERINVMLPCCIEKYDRSKHIADLRILFNWKMADGSVVDGCVLYDITIRRLLAGGFLIDFPIAVGDTGWIFACDRDAYDSKVESKPRLPPTPYCNSFASGFWIPDQWGSDTKLGISGVDSNRLVIQSKDGTQKISVGTSDIHITATTLNVTGNVVINGNTQMNGTLNTSGLITAQSDIQNGGSGGITLATHVHTSSQAGTDTSAGKNAG